MSISSTWKSGRLWFALAAAAALALAGFVVALAKPSGAPAQATNGVYECQFTGAAGPIDPPVPAVLNGLGGSGTYEFDSAEGADPVPGAVLCAYDDGSGDPQVSEGRIQSSGSYTNTICGTGQAFSNPAADSSHSTTVEFDNPAVPNIVSVTYHIEFSGGVGTLEITEAENANNETGSGAGVVDITPEEGNCVDEDVSRFSVAGQFTATAD